MPKARRRGPLAAALAALLLASLLALFAGGEASAHANLVRSEPAANEVLPSPPPRVRAWFSEPLAPDFSELTVLDEAGERVDLGDSRVDPDGVSMTVSLPPLDPGAYTVAWRNLSTVDGHSLRGAFTFFVGVEPGAVAPLEEGPPLVQSPLEPVVRWIVLLGALGALGALLVDAMVVRPVLTRRDAHPALAERATALAARVGLLALAVLLAGSLAHLWVQAAVLSEGGPLAALGEPLRAVVLRTDWGRAWLWRLGFTMAAVAAVALSLDRRTDAAQGARLRFAAAIFGIGVLASISAASHAAAATGVRAPAVAADFLHLLAAAAWTGGLLQLLLSVRLIRGGLVGGEMRTVLAPVVSRFSLVAAVSVAVLVVTGLYSSWVQVTVVRALDTAYGWTLLAKVAAVGALLGIGAVNLLVVRRALSRDAARAEAAARRLSHLVRGEVALAIVVIALVGLLTSLEPAWQTAVREDARRGVAFTGGDQTTRIQVHIQPGRVGPNTATVEVSDRRGEPVTHADRIIVRVRYLARDLGATEVSASQAEGGRYVADVQLSLTGLWQAEVEVERPGAFDARAVERFELGGAAGSGQPLVTPRRAWQLATAGTGVLGLSLLGIGLLAGRDRRLPDTPVLATGVGLIALTFVLVARIPGEQPALAANPFPPTAESIEAGRSIYVQQCAVCHGPTGLGDGPQAPGLTTLPANLVLHVPLHSDAELFAMIARGVTGTDMPAFADALTEEEIWHVLNYLRTLDGSEAER